MQVNTEDVITGLLYFKKWANLRLLYCHYVDTMYGIILLELC